MAGVNFLYYCSLGDVADILLNAVKDWESSAKKLSDAKVMGHIRRAYADLNSALAAGGYDVPAVNGTKTTLDTAVEKSINATAEAVADGSAFSAGDTTRVHGLNTSIYRDEFVGIVLVASNTITFRHFINDYDLGATVELCTDGYMYLNSCNAKGAAYKALASLAVGQARSKNERVDELKEDWKDCLELLRDGEVKLDGLGASRDLVGTFQTENPDDASVGPVITLTGKF